MAGSQNHTFADTELHFAGCQIGDHDGVLTNQISRLVGAGNTAQHIAHTAFAHIQRQAEQLDRAFDCLAINDFGNAQIDFREVVDGNGRGQGFTARITHYDFSSCLRWQLLGLRLK